MKRAFCTITTASHISETLALYHSIQQVDPKIRLNVLITDVVQLDLPEECENLRCYYLPDLKTDTLCREIIEKYKDKKDELRWSMKPVFLKYLINVEGYDSLVYNDNDLFYFNDFAFLFDALEERNILLSPHWRIADPTIDKDWFETNFKDGLYNAGFLGINRNAADAMEWWAKCCLYACEKDPSRGLWDDQRYLDLFPVLFEKVEVLKHRGCNVAYWNQHECERVKIGDEVRINGQWPVIFIHFTRELINSIRQGQDHLLKPHLGLYLSVLEK